MDAKKFEAIDAKISWNMSKSLQSMRWIQDDKFEAVPLEYLDFKLPIAEGDRIVILRFRDNEPITTSLTCGSTVRTMFQIIESELQIPRAVLELKQRQSIQALISNIRSADTRQELEQKLDAGTLCLRDLLIGPLYYEGGLRRGENGLWTYGIGT